MTFTGGEHVRLKPTPDRKHSSVGTVVGVSGNSIEVEYRMGFGERSRVTKTHNAAQLEEMCREPVYRGYGSTECGRVAKENHLCGIHLSHQKRREAERIERQRKNTEWEENRKRLTLKNEEMLATIAEHGLKDTVRIYDTDKELVMLRLDDLLSIQKGTE